jgi:hypothetical protein
MMKYVKVGNWKPVLGGYLIFKDNLWLWFLERFRNPITWSYGFLKIFGIKKPLVLEQS